MEIHNPSARRVTSDLALDPNKLNLVKAEAVYTPGKDSCWIVTQRRSHPAKGGELEQIQFLLGHASILTTERYLEPAEMVDIT